jgi:hypothetical protein
MKFFEWKSPLLVLKPFVPAHNWYFTFFHAGNVFQPQEQDLLPSGRFCKSLKIKFTGELSRHMERGNQ